MCVLPRIWRTFLFKYRFAFTGTLLEVRHPSETASATSYLQQAKALRVVLSYALRAYMLFILFIILFYQKRDVEEGADIIMVKPALPYLDVIQDAAELAQDHPLACYQVSGEFAMIHAGAKAGVYDLRTMAFETSESLVRAGAFITPSLIHYFAERCI